MYLVGFLMDVVWLGLIFSIFNLFLVAVSLSVVVSRLHDFDRTGWWALLIFIPVVNLIFCIMLFFTPGNKNKNKYGEVSGKYNIFTSKDVESLK